MSQPMPVTILIQNGKPVPQPSVPITRPSRASEAQVQKAFEEFAGPNPSRRGAILMGATTALAIAAAGAAGLWPAHQPGQAKPAVTQQATPR